jgi:DNA (cytosine-5)-methyltransferase 1
MANGNKNKNNWWHTEPNVGRVADGVSDRTHRLKSLGNAVVPQIPYYIAKSILEVRDA